MIFSIINPINIDPISIDSINIDPINIDFISNDLQFVFNMRDYILMAYLILNFNLINP